VSTTRRIHIITETDQVSDAIDNAARIWPELSAQRTLLLGKILEAGIETVKTRACGNTRVRLANVQDLADSMESVWPTHWKNEFANDWPN
jgi:hypothetical protein